MSVSVFLRGGLGNQLFQYSAGLFLARKQNEELVLRTELLPRTQDAIAGVSRFPVQISDFRFEGKIYSSSSQPPQKTNSFSKIMQVHRMIGDVFPKTFLRTGVLAGEGTFCPSFETTNRIWLINSYASSPEPAYLLGDYLRSQIRDLVSPSDAFINFTNEAKSSLPVMVHVRLGDYQNLAHLYGKQELSKLAAAIAFSRDSDSQPVWLFTNSPENFSRETLKTLGVSLVVGPEQLTSPLENLLLLSLGSRLICANSTLSWWASFLRGEEEQGKVLFPVFNEVPVQVFSGQMTQKNWIPYQAN